MRGDGARVWYDEWEIRSGDVILQKIESGLEAARSLVLALSPHAFELGGHGADHGQAP